MKYTFESNTLEIIWNGLNETPKSTNHFAIENLYLKFLKRGWVFEYEIEDIFYHLNRGVYSIFLERKSMDEIYKGFEIDFETIYDKPKATDSSVMGYHTISINNFVFLLIQLEKIGFNTNPIFLVEKLLPALKQKKYLSKSELEIFWYNKTRLKNETIFLSIENYHGFFLNPKKLKTELGFKIKVEFDEENKPVYFEIVAPKFRKKTFTYPTTCEDCDYTWQKGDPSSSASHRRVHKRAMNCLNPQPLERIKELDKINKDYILVTADSPKWQHFEMYERAYAFKKEFRYDFVQYQSREGHNDENIHGYLFINENDSIIGACCFRKNELEWGLDWIWICPIQRRKNHLANKWKMFKELYGNFYVEPPVSDEMKSFIKKHDSLPL